MIFQGNDIIFGRNKILFLDYIILFEQNNILINETIFWGNKKYFKEQNNQSGENWY